MRLLLWSSRPAISLRAGSVEYAFADLREERPVDQTPIHGCPTFSSAAVHYRGVC
jgi:hypothetical protein